MSEEKMTGRLPQFIRRDVERAIEAAINPKGMSVHDGKALIGADHLQYMLALIDQTMKSENSSAKQKYDELMQDCEETSPIERLRFYCSLAMSGQDWLDVESFIDALHQESEAGAVAKVIRNSAGQIVMQNGEGGCFDISQYVDKSFYLAPPSAPAIEAAAIMRCVEVLEDRAKEWDKITTGTHASSYAGELRFMRKAILALIPQDGQTELEEFGMKCIDGVLNLNPHLWTEHNLRAIVNQVMKEVGN